MRKSRFSDEQIIGILKEAEAGAKVSELIRTHGISGNTFYLCLPKTLSSLPKRPVGADSSILTRAL